MAEPSLLKKVLSFLPIIFALAYFACMLEKFRPLRHAERLWQFGPHSEFARVCKNVFNYVRDNWHYTI